MNRLLLTSCTAWLVAVPSAVLAATPITPPVMYPANTWQGRSQAIVRVLDRQDSHVELLTIPVGSTQPFKSLSITAKACLDRPPTLSADAAVSLEVADSHPDGVHFTGWMLAAEPSLNVLDSPVYDLRVVSCSGDPVAPTPIALKDLAGVLQAAVAPTTQNTTNPAQPDGAPVVANGVPAVQSAASAPGGVTQPGNAPPPQTLSPPATQPNPVTPYVAPAAPPPPSEAPTQLAPTELTPPPQAPASPQPQSQSPGTTPGQNGPTQLAPPVPYQN